MRRKTATSLIAVLTAVGLSTVVAPPAAASVTGSVTFECTADLPTWATAEDRGTCGDGLVPAWGHASLSGIDGTGVPYTVDGSGAFFAEFTYRNGGCITELGWPQTGVAQGTAAIRNLPAVHGLTRTVADVYATFTWTRIGVFADLRVTSWSVTLHGGPVESGSSGAGAGVFEPLLGPGPYCNSGGPMQAVVEGEVTATG